MVRTTAADRLGMATGVAACTTSNRPASHSMGGQARRFHAVVSSADRQLPIDDPCARQIHGDLRRWAVLPGRGEERQLVQRLRFAPAP